MPGFHHEEAKAFQSFVGSVIGVETIQTFGRKILALPLVTIGLLFVMGAEGVSDEGMDDKDEVWDKGEASRV